MGSIEKIKKRNGQLADFDPKKITLVVEKAFLAVLNDPHTNEATSITDQVVRKLEARKTEVAPHVEEVQDEVERGLMARGFFDVAKAYIIYRYEHQRIREAEKVEAQQKIAEHELPVVKRSGRIEAFDVSKLRRTLSFAIAGYEDVIDVDSIVMQCKTEVYENITTKEIANSLVMVTRSFIERDPAYSAVASRLLLAILHKEAIGNSLESVVYEDFEAQYRKAFVANIQRGVKIGKLDERMLSFNLEEMATKLVPVRDDLLRYLGTQTLNDRYFIRDTERDTTLETPQYMWMRVAMGLALEEDNKEARATEFYNIISSLRFVPSTPTLFHAGTRHPQLSSCYLNTVKDDLGHIFKVYRDNAMLSKWAGGIGTDWGGLRGTGALIKTAGIHSQGVIPFLKIANDVTVAINRSGRRRGATAVYLECWHYDFENFIELRKNTGDERRRTHDINTASWIPDLFMKRVREDGQWTLFSPDETPELHETYGKKFEEHYARYEKMADEGKIALFKRMKARDLWRKMLGMLFETGHPWVTFKDPSNIRSPQDHVGVVHNSNLCTEITLNTSEEETAVCNLGSVNFSRHITDQNTFDKEKVRETVTIAMRMLDNVVDLNFYPTVEARTSNMRHRPVGLGIMGFQDALYRLNIDFASEECVKFADESMEIVSYYAILASSELAKERGPYESFPGSKWDRGILPVDTIALLEAERGEEIAVDRETRLDWGAVRENIRKFGMRNSNTMAMAPTATIANISGCIPTIEPIYKNIYVKSNISGDFIVVNSYLIEELKKENLWDDEMLGKLKYNDGKLAAIPEVPQRLKDKYKETFEIDMRWLLKAAAYRGKWVDQSQSLNIFFSGSSGKELSDIYMHAWELGLKTTYYLRTMAASQVEKSTVNTSQYGATHRRGNNDGGEKTPARQPEAPKVEIPQPSPVPAPSPVTPKTPEPVAVANRPMPKIHVAQDSVCESCE